MCELFAVSADRDIRPNEWLKSFFEHSDKNPHGWGMAMFYGRGAVALEKEPVRADQSRYLKERLRQDIVVSAMLAHIREATIGTPDYCNTHPFVNRDHTGRCWTLVHNGTIFESAVLSPYIFRQEGETDSERILCYIIDQMNWHTEKKQRELTDEERCEVIDTIIKTLAPGNKLNILLFDGEVLYAHTNMANTLYFCLIGEARIFATVPFRITFQIHWQEMPFLRVCAYRGQKQIYQGSPHSHIYHEDPEKLRYLHMTFAGL